MYSTVEKYVNAVQKENQTWPVYYNDFFPFAEDSQEYWSGPFSSRGAFKKQVKDYSSLLHAQSKMFARRMIDQKSTDKEIKEVLQVQDDAIDSLALSQHHDGISGTEVQYVANDYS